MATVSDQHSDYWDGNWVVVTAECASGSSRVRATGPILHLGELETFVAACARAFENLGASASLDGIEPNLHLQLTGDGKGHFALVVSLTPDHMVETHEYRQEIDQTYLPAIVRMGQKLLERYPVVGERPA